MTTTAIIGLGNMGKGLAKRLAGKTDLIVSAGDTAAANAFAATLPSGVIVLDRDSAIARADIVILALPYALALEAAASSALAGKIVLDITNPLKADFSGLTIGHTTSAAEELQAAAPSARVVKGYNTIFATLLDRSASDTSTVPVYLAGNDESAVDAVAALVTLSGFAAERAGRLEVARLIEPLGMLNIHFGLGLGQGGSIAPSWIKLAA